MKRILWTITAVGALAVPVGIATAQADDDVTETDPPTTVECDREQLRLHDGTGDQARTQERLHAEDCDGCEEAELRHQYRSEEGQGDMVRHQYRVEEGQGDMVRHQYRVEDCDGCTGDQSRDRVRVQDGVEGGDVPGQQDMHRYQEQDREPGNEGAPDRTGR